MITYLKFHLTFKHGVSTSLEIKPIFHLQSEILT